MTRHERRVVAVPQATLAALDGVATDARCDAGLNLPSATSEQSIVEDDASGADVTCRFDGTRFEAMLYADVGGIEVRGTFDGSRSTDADLRFRRMFRDERGRGRSIEFAFRVHRVHRVLR